MGAHKIIRRFRRGWYFLAIAAGLASPVRGDSIVTLSGQVQLVPLPSSVVLGALQNDNYVSLFQEQSDITLGANLPFDAGAPGVYSTKASLTPGVLAAGMVVSDFYFDSNPIRKTGTTFTGSITFSSQILGVIALVGTLNATDGILGAAGVQYPENDSQRGLELADEDVFSISPDSLTLVFNATVYTDVDQLRIVVAGDNESIVPEPGTIVLLALGLVVGGCFRKSIAGENGFVRSKRARRKLPAPACDIGKRDPDRRGMRPENPSPLPICR